ncbi:glycosyl hydrolase 115 family protein [Mangrovibacterium sp.]|uniref:glycosyl hydrolase 115 family protein n=1 Tax=Mangrovibacterium sp. TaxID=1961364 RepID=UPI003561E6AF
MFKNGLKIVVASLFMLAFSGSLYAQKTTDFPIVSVNGIVGICIDPQDAKVVDIAAHMLADDIEKVTGRQISVTADLTDIEIIAGTIGSSKIIDQIISEHQIDVSRIEGKWETYSIQVIENPVKGVRKSLLIIGSDRRATAFGLLEISRMIGVSPWEWWADVTPDKKTELTVAIEQKNYGAPSVKYRGIFLNDEDWGLQRWAALNYEPETGDIGPKTYAKVFELLLRLRANTLWPAMHSCTKPFYSYPQNKQVADDYAIVVGTSHCEPMLCNINAEWNSHTMGEWRYDNNSETIKKLFQQRTKESAPFESMYTMGMRGEHDSPMMIGEIDLDSQVKLLEKVVADQREILRTTTGREAVTIPQVFIPYKEVLDCYQNGMQLPEDISLMWTDDNYGYIRQLSNPDEQKRPGGAGIYYHTSYWGRPHDYLWLNSTNPVLMWEEMSKAYEFQSRDVWILNCGDIKPHEYNIELFLDMAWSMCDFGGNTGVKSHMRDWAAREFGASLADPITQIMFEYYRLAFQRRPEFMAWSQVEPVTKAGETELNQIHYGDEVSQRIEAYQKLIDATEKAKTDVAANRKDAFYELVYYPVIGAASLNHKWLYAYKNEFVARQGRSSAAFYGEKSVAAFERIQHETAHFNGDLQGGKWDQIMSMAPRQLPVFSTPTIAGSPGSSQPELGLALESYQMEVNYDVINSYADVLPVFNAYTDNHYFVDVFLKGEGEISWTAQPRADWIHISDQNGTLRSKSGEQEQRLWVSIDWDKVPVGENKKEAPLGHDYQLIPPSYKVNSAIDFVTADTTISIGISVFNPKLNELENYRGFVEDKGFVSIYAENYTRETAGKQARWEQIEGLGYTGKVVTALPRTANGQIHVNEIIANSPALEYEFYTFNFGETDVHIQAVPTHAFYEGSGVRCAVSVDGSEPVLVDFKTLGRSDEWKDNVLRNASVKTVKQTINKAGKHTLKIWMVDPGVLIDQILIDLGGWKKSYAFPAESKM